jgi:hypothetical protein
MTVHPSWTFGHQALYPSDMPVCEPVWGGIPCKILICIFQFIIEGIPTTGYRSCQLWLVWHEQSKAVLSRVIESRIGLRGVFGERKRIDGKCHNIVLTVAPIRYWMSWEDHSPVRCLIGQLTIQQCDSASRINEVALCDRASMIGKWVDGVPTRQDGSSLGVVESCLVQHCLRDTKAR